MSNKLMTLRYTTYTPVHDPDSRFELLYNIECKACNLNSKVKHVK